MQIVEMQFVVMGIDRVVDWKRYVGGTELCRGLWEIRYLKVTCLFLHNYATAFYLFVNVRNRDAMLSQNDPSSSCFFFCIPSRRANRASSTSSACCFFLFLDFYLP